MQRAECPEICGIEHCTAITEADNVIDPGLATTGHVDATDHTAIIVATQHHLANGVPFAGAVKEIGFPSHCKNVPVSQRTGCAGSWHPASLTSTSPRPAGHSTRSLSVATAASHGSSDGHLIPSHSLSVSGTSFL